MTFARKFPVGRLDLGLRRIGLNTQKFVVVNHCASLNSKSQRCMPGQPEDTARHSLESIAPCASILRRVLLFTEMAVRLRGVPKGSRGKPRAAFEGARTNNKATRTLWRVALPSTTAMPFAVFQKTLGKTDQGSPIKSKSVNNRRHQLSTVNDTCAADLRGWTRIRKTPLF
jgi:hypothetical protein